MRFISLAALLSALLCIDAGSQTTPIASFGSNPYFSTHLFPQDLLLRSGSYLFYSPQYQNRPWWGDVDEPMKRPTSNSDYTITGTYIENKGGSFKYDGSYHSFNNNLGYAYQFSDRLMTSIALDYNVDALRSRYEADITGDGGYEDANGRLPLEYSSRHTFNYLNLEGMIGSQIGGIPFGLKINGGMETTLALRHDLAFSILEKSGEDSSGEDIETIYSSGHYLDYVYSGNDARLFWGPSLEGCSHPFGVHGTQADMWVQNEYSVGPVYHVDLLAGATFPFGKTGVYGRFKWGHQERYRWESDEDRWEPNSFGIIDSTIARNFVGNYVKQETATINSAGEGRLFSNITWRGGDRYALRTFTSVGYLDSTRGSAPASNLEAQSTSKEKLRSVYLECDPNISVKLDNYLNYVDAAALFRYRYSRYSNNTVAWMDGGGQLPAYRNSRYNIWDDGWEGSDERCSYANENAFDIGADLSTMFPLFDERAHFLALNFRLIGQTRLTFKKKYFGNSVESNNDVTFEIENIRKNYDRELLFNTFLMLHYQTGPYQLRLQVNKPVLYSIKRHTSVTDADGDSDKSEFNYPLEKSPQWITMEGIRIALYASYDVVLPFLRR